MDYHQLRKTPQYTLAPRIVPPRLRSPVYELPLFLRVILTPLNLLTRTVGGLCTVASFLCFRALPGFFPREPEHRGGGLTKLLEALPVYKDGYAQAYDAAKRDSRFLLVLLTSPRHPAVHSFVAVLESLEVQHFLQDPDLVLWAGDVLEPEAYQVSVELGCTSLPGAVLIGEVNNSMSILAHLPSTSAFASTAKTVVQQHRAGLVKLRQERGSQQATRTLRQEQNSAYERSLAQDRAKAQLKREAEARSEAAELETQQAEKYRQYRDQWRRWRAERLVAEPDQSVLDKCRISFRLASGERIVRSFPSNASVEELYAFVDCLGYAQDPGSPAPPKDYVHSYDFSLVAPMPRVLHAPDKEGVISSIIGKSGSLVVEPGE